MRKYPAIPEPMSDLQSLRQSVVALKQVIEILLRQRGAKIDGAVTWQDLVDLGLITSDKVPS